MLLITVDALSKSSNTVHWRQTGNPYLPGVFWSSIYLSAFCHYVTHTHEQSVTVANGKLHSPVSEREGSHHIQHVRWPARSL